MAGVEFGAVVREVVQSSVKPGDTVEAVFQSACPRNNLKTGETFLAVERLADNGDWEVVSLTQTITVILGACLGSRALVSLSWLVCNSSAH